MGPLCKYICRYAYAQFDNYLLFLSKIYNDSSLTSCNSVQSSREINARYFPVQMWTQSLFYFYLGNCEQIVPPELYALVFLSN